MEQLTSVFDVFGGIRPMARALSESPSKIMSWKRTGRIPAQKQASVLSTAEALGLPVTAEHIVFPLGHHQREVAGTASDVTCGQRAKTQRKGAQ